ncbi:MAG: hypothetical protein QOC98_2264, partial [Frankiaceae bacterium]|nr:hypothetical protein [Frankiaceae bacterium]
PVDAVLPLGDEQYNCGGLSAFQQVYNPTWGAQKAVTNPVPGNHEYQTSGGTNCPSAHNASAYFSYFGASAGDPAKGYYSFNLGAWHIVALNSELCYGQSPYNQSPIGGTAGCGAGSAQETWLKTDLATNKTACTMAYWHEPRWYSYGGGSDDSTDAWMKDLYAAKADVVLTGHQHFYERFAQQNPAGGLDTANGIRQFIVGTGGESFMPLRSPRNANSQASNDNTFGVLKMGLHAASYDFNFVPIAGSSYTDSGTTACHGTPAADTTPPTTTATLSPAANASGWNNTTPVSVTLSATDTGGAGVDKTYYTTDGTTPTTSSTIYGGPIPVNATTTVKFFSVDKAGQAEAVNSRLVQVDKNTPTTSISCNGGPCASTYSSSVSVALSPADTGGSGVALTRYTTDGSDPSSSSTAITYTAPFSVASTTTVKYISTDRAGNAEPTNSQAISVNPAPGDTVAPTTAIRCNGATCSSGFYTSAVSVTLTATDTGGAGVASTRYTIDGSDPSSSSTARTYTAPFSVASTSTVKYLSTDNAGNAETPQSQVVQVDTSSPTTSVSCNGGACATWYRTSPVTVSLTASGIGSSGVGSTRYTTDGTDPTTSSTATTYTAPFSVATTATVRAFSTNGAGGRGPTVSQAVQIDTVAPTTPFKCGTAGDPCGTDAYPSPVLVTLAASDAGGSGLARTRYTVVGSDPAISPTATTYSHPFSLTTTSTVRAFSSDVAGNIEPTNSQVITVTPGSGAPGTLTLTPTDDSYTSKGNPTGTHPSDASININGGTSERRAYTKFTVAGLPPGATNVTASLRLYSQSVAPSTVVVTASKTDTSWNEATLTWNNQPAPGPALSTKSGLTSGVYNTFDVTGFVTGNGTYSVVLTDADTTQRFFNSKEAATNRPQLIVNYVGP